MKAVDDTSHTDLINRQRIYVSDIKSGHLNKNENLSVPKELEIYSLTSAVAIRRPLHFNRTHQWIFSYALVIYIFHLLTGSVAWFLVSPITQSNGLTSLMLNMISLLLTQSLALPCHYMTRYPGLLLWCVSYFKSNSVLQHVSISGTFY